MKPFYKEAHNYLLWGALFGCLFPIIAMLIELYASSGPVNIQQIITIQKETPLLWIIDTAPFFLGFFAFLIGRQIDRLKGKNQEILDAQAQLVLQEQMASIGKMTAGIAHEIKNPLNFVRNFAEGSTEMIEDLEEEIKNNQSGFDQETFTYLLELLGDLRQNAEDIKHNSERVNRIVFTLMDHTRGSKGSEQATDINVLLDENINLAYHSYRANYSSFNLDIQKDYDSSIPIIKMNSHSLGRVLLNILNNACYALNQKQSDLKNDFDPLLQVKTKKDRDQLIIIIEDNGYGIPENIRKKIFDPFFTTKPTGSGNSGLGLSISKDIIMQEYEGSIEVESESGLFTKFIIKIPLNQWIKNTSSLLTAEKI